MGILFLVCSLLPLPDQLPSPPPMLSFKGACRGVWLTKGSILACRVRNGMTEEQVRRILGDRYDWRISSSARMDVYHDFAIQVFWYSWVEEGRSGQPLVVKEVRYVWECWKAWGDTAAR